MPLSIKKYEKKKQRRKKTLGLDFFLATYKPVYKPIIK